MAELFSRHLRPPSQPYLPCPLVPEGLLESVTRLKREGLRGRDLRKQKQRLRVEAKGGRLPLLPYSARRLMLGVLRHLLSRKLRARQINTDGGRDSDALFMGLVTGPLLSQSH